SSACLACRLALGAAETCAPKSTCGSSTASRFSTCMLPFKAIIYYPFIALFPNTLASTINKSSVNLCAFESAIALTDF
ncbi:hypothetical protein, partial [Borreliella burgdorferi]|uniref:hypothetical protein n=1 Tax=Borreliella burgdorferi TaxID=139 RepID=UPI001E640B84